jgi:RimJ/RimL family protein N-acetyltransferase
MLNDESKQTLQACRVTTTAELEQILALQRRYLRGVRTADEEKDQGFLTVAHSLETLQRMHDQEPSVIVKAGEELAGFALVMTRTSREWIPELLPFFDYLDQLSYKDKPVATYNYYVIGQVCVAEAWRGKGVFDLLYQHHKDCFAQRFDFVITEIATRNTRSMRAHQRVGFRELAIHRDYLDEWAVVLWEYRSLKV